MEAGTLTPDTSTLVEVARRNLWFTLLRGAPFSLKGPVTRSRPVSRLLRTMTLLPLWTPARTMATVPAERLDLTVLLCLEKKLTEVPGAAASLVGLSAANFLTLTILVPPFLAPPTFFSTKIGVLVTVFLTAFFLANL